MKTDIAGELIVEFIRDKEETLDPEKYFWEMEDHQENLEMTLKEENLSEVIMDAVSLLYSQICFNYTIASADQLGLLSEDRRKKFEEFIQKSDETYQKAMNFIGKDIDLFDAFRRYHNYRMERVDNFVVIDLCS